MTVLAASDKPSGVSSAKLVLYRLLARYLTALAARPLRTKCITSATLLFIQETLSSRLSGSPKPALPAKGTATRKYVPIQVWGLLRELGVGEKNFQKIFAGKTDALSKILQIIAMQLIQSPITALAYISSMAVINGARSTEAIKKTVQAGYFSILKSMWISSPIAIAFAQKFLPAETWVVWFNLVSFTMGTFMTVLIKRKQLALQAHAKKQNKE
ncbi:hypothetical protein QFC21_002922 [Naganishia friedmannii]|uniref:Uncharacterized protein n=1 Tax=Naganishia friedmannii TaxID=89922 RepID=A0ACC2VVB1_9TREE|nr:hypothetical protein QFC21_002922 [Naganishia friedmannii]